MKKLIGPGRIIYAIGLLGLGILCILSKVFIVGRPPAWPEWLNINPILAYGSGLVLILGAAAILLKKNAGLVALSIAALILILSVLRQVPDILNGWLNTYKSLALIGGALIVAASFFEEKFSADSMLRVNDKSINRLVLVGCFLLAVFFIACGYAHFKFGAFVIDFIPSFYPIS